MNLGRQGSVVMGSIVGALLVALACLWTGQRLISNRASALAVYDKGKAQAYAIELLELFRSYTRSQLKSYLSTNPATGTIAAYTLCANVNILDRKLATPALLNPDPLAELSPNHGFSMIEYSVRPNRYYRVQILNVETSTLRNDVCNNTAREIYWGAPAAGETILLTDKEQFFVTVGVSWVPPGKSADQLEEVVLNTVVPND